MIEALLGIPGKVKTLLDRLTDTRAANLENINLTRMGKIDTINTNVNTTVSSRAAQTTADNIYARTDVASSTRASQTSVDTLTNRLNDQRALNLDNLLGVSLSQLPCGKVLTNDIGSYPNLHQNPGNFIWMGSTYSPSFYNYIPANIVTATVKTGVLTTYINNLTGPGVITFLQFHTRVQVSGTIRAVVIVDGSTVCDRTQAMAGSTNGYNLSCVGSMINANAYIQPVFSFGQLAFRSTLTVQMQVPNTSSDMICAISFYRWA